MGRFGDYVSDMRDDSFTYRSIERLLSGGVPEDEELAGLAPFVDMLRAERGHILSDADTARYAAEAAEVVRSKRTGLADGIDPERELSKRRREVMTLKPKIAAALAALLLFSGMTGVAFAADGAVPGDTLYGLDRALESVGVGDGGAAERLDEVRELVEDGRPEAGLAHIDEALTEAGFDGRDAAELTQAKAALQAASDAILGVEEGSEHASEVRVGVSTLLQYMGENLGDGIGADGEDFGQGVAELANEISPDGAEGAAEDAQTPEDVPAADTGVPEDVPTDDTGAPEGVPESDAGDNSEAPEDLPDGRP